jgi:hypothetical protein
LEPGGAVIWEAFRAGWGSWWAGGCGCLLPGWCLSRRGRAPVVPHGAGAQQSLMGGGSPRGRGSVVPHTSVAQQGLKGSKLGEGGAGIPASCGTGSGLGSCTDRWQEYWCGVDLGAGGWCS